MTSPTSEKAPCCCVCCSACRWLHDFYEWLVGNINNGKFIATFLEGPFSGHAILAPSDVSIGGACVQWKTESFDITTCSSQSSIGEFTFYCEEPGISDFPLKFIPSLTVDTNCGPIITLEPEFCECTPPPPGELFGQLTLRYRYVIEEVLEGGCDSCGGIPQDMVIEITRYT